jgi:hypothetical protein
MMKRVHLIHQDPPTWNQPLLLTEVMVEEVMAVATEVEVQVTEDTGEEVTDIQGTCNSIFLFTIKSNWYSDPLPSESKL